MTNKEHREKIEKCAAAFAASVNAAIADDMIVSVDFDKYYEVGKFPQVIANVSCEPSIDSVLFNNENEGCEDCIHWSVQRACMKQVSIQGHAPDCDFKCKWWEKKE
ncbi:hypothetical protein [uncultured Desulfovibrio sp.]|uniref:hypothetical protein n=1 Tax=uncultured Desulfovibrio sp. TaxID=167968 RepID=UPI00272D9F9F|nr:hypothetical protein [uncultured Desulfovibrio sp.]